jgi:hypothetical protein
LLGTRVSRYSHIFFSPPIMSDSKDTQQHLPWEIFCSNAWLNNFSLPSLVPSTLPTCMHPHGALDSPRDAQRDSSSSPASKRARLENVKVARHIHSAFSFRLLPYQSTGYQGQTDRAYPTQHPNPIGDSSSCMRSLKSRGYEHISKERLSSPSTNVLHLTAFD